MEAERSIFFSAVVRPQYVGNGRFVDSEGRPIHGVTIRSLTMEVVRSEGFVTSVKMRDRFDIPPYIFKNVSRSLSRQGVLEKHGNQYRIVDGRPQRGRPPVMWVLTSEA